MKYTYAHSSGKTLHKNSNRKQQTKHKGVNVTMKSPQPQNSQILRLHTKLQFIICLFIYLKEEEFHQQTRKIMRIVRMSRGKLFSKVGFTDLMIESDIIRYRIHSDGSLTSEFQGVDLKFSLKPG